MKEHLFTRKFIARACDVHVTQRVLNLRARVNNATWYRWGMYCWTQGKYGQNCNFAVVCLMKQLLWCRYFAERFNSHDRSRPNFHNSDNINSVFEWTQYSLGILLLSNICKREQIREMQISPSIDLPRTSARKLNALYLAIRKQALTRVWRTRLEFQNGLVDD